MRVLFFKNIGKYDVAVFSIQWIAERISHEIGILIHFRKGVVWNQFDNLVFRITHFRDVETLHLVQSSGGIKIDIGNEVDSAFSDLISLWQEFRINTETKTKNMDLMFIMITF